MRAWIRHSASLTMLLAEGLFSPLPGGMGVYHPPALPDTGIGDADGAIAQRFGVAIQVRSHRQGHFPGRGQGLGHPTDPAKPAELLQGFGGIQGTVGHPIF